MASSASSRQHQRRADAPLRTEMDGQCGEAEPSARQCRPRYSRAACRTVQRRSCCGGGAEVQCRSSSARAWPDQPGAQVGVATGCGCGGRCQQLAVATGSWRFARPWASFARCWCDSDRACAGHRSRKVRRWAQQRLHCEVCLEQRAPLERGQRPQAGDDVARRYCWCCGAHAGAGCSHRWWCRVAPAAATAHPATAGRVRPCPAGDAPAAP